MRGLAVASAGLWARAVPLGLTAEIATVGAPPQDPRPAVVQGSAGDRCDSKRVPQHTRCTGCPPMYNGKPCASTTRYNDQTKAACGCGESDPIPSDWWTLTKLTAALNCKNLDPSNPKLSWCPSGCGGCYRLCTTGGTTQGIATKPGVCRVFKITNRCGDGFDLEHGRDWCSQHMTWQECQEDPERCKKDGNTNWFGYSAHFDLQDFHHQVYHHGLDWDNVEVTFEPVHCGAGNWTGPSWDCSCPAIQDKAPQSGSTPAASPMGGTIPSVAPAVPASGITPLPWSPPTGPGLPPVPSATQPAAPVRQTPVPQLPVPQTPAPQMPVPQTPAPPTPAPPTPAPPTLPPPTPAPPTPAPPTPAPQTPAPQMPVPQTPMRCARAFEQCGGKTWSGPTCCEPGCRCSETVALFWRQCMPPSGAKTCSGEPIELLPGGGSSAVAPRPAWANALVRKDAIDTSGGDLRWIWMADGTREEPIQHQQSTAIALVSGGLLLALVAVAFLGLGSCVALGAASLRARLRHGSSPRAGAGSLALGNAGHAGGRLPGRPPVTPPRAAGRFEEPASPTPMLSLAC